MFFITNQKFIGIAFIFYAIIVLPLQSEEIDSKELNDFNFILRSSSGKMPNNYPVIAPGLGVVSILAAEPFSRQQYEMIAYAAEFEYNLKSEHTSIGIEKSFKSSLFSWNLLATYSRYHGKPYNVYFNIYYYDYYTLPALSASKGFLKNTDVPFILSYIELLLFDEITAGVNYETINIEYGIKVKADLFRGIKFQFALDGGVGSCMKPESCTSYIITPSYGIVIPFYYFSVVLEQYHRYTWLEFGKNSMRVNMKSHDAFSLTLMVPI